MRGPAMPPQRTANRAHASPSGALLLPQLLARSGYFVPGLGFRRSTPGTRQMMANGLVQQRFVDRSGEYRVGQVQRADFFVAEIDDVYAGHDYCFALRTTT